MNVYVLGICFMWFCFFCIGYFLFSCICIDMERFQEEKVVYQEGDIFRMGIYSQVRQVQLRWVKGYEGLGFQFFFLCGDRFQDKVGYLYCEFRVFWRFGMWCYIGLWFRIGSVNQYSYSSVNYRQEIWVYESSVVGFGLLLGYLGYRFFWFLRVRG